MLVEFVNSGFPADPAPNGFTVDPKFEFRREQVIDKLARGEGSDHNFGRKRVKHVFFGDLLLFYGHGCIHLSSPISEVSHGLGQSPTKS